MKKAIIIGGGIGGLCTAIALRKVGIDAELFEKAEQIKAVGAGLAIGGNAGMAFKAMGMLDKVMTKGLQLNAADILNSKGKLISSMVVEDVAERMKTVLNFTIHRADLHQILLDEIPSSSFHTGKACTGIKHRDNKVVANFADGSEAEGDFLIAADGIHSVIREQLAGPGHVRYAGYTCWRGVTDHVPSDFIEGRFTETWGNKGRFGIVPLYGNKIYWFALRNSKLANNETYSKYKREDLLRHFQYYHKPVAELIQNTAQENIFWNDISDLKPLRQFAWGNVLLIGDAAHATTPNLGQGACQAIEDAAVLAGLIKKNPDIQEVFRAFESHRIKRTKRVIDTSRKVGKMAQLSNPVLTGLRNFGMRRVPEKQKLKGIEWLFEVVFDSLGEGIFSMLD